MNVNMIISVPDLNSLNKHNFIAVYWQSTSLDDFMFRIVSTVYEKVLYV